jgi:DNA primase
LYDSDKAGEAATMRGLELFIEEGMDVKIVRLPAGHDPDSFIKENGLERFNEELAAAKTLFDYKLGTLKQKYDANTLEGKVKIAGEMVQLLSRVKNEILRGAWIKELAAHLALSEESLVAEMKKSRPDGGSLAKREDKSVQPRARVAMRAAEKMILGLLFDNTELAALAKDELRPEDFEDERARSLSRRLLDADEPPSVAKLMTLYGEDADMMGLISEASAEADRSDDKRKAFLDCAAELKRSRLIHQRDDLRAKLQDAERVRDHNRIGEILRNINEVNKGIRQIDEKK